MYCCATREPGQQNKASSPGQLLLYLESAVLSSLLLKGSPRDLFTVNTALDRRSSCFSGTGVGGM